MLKKIVFSFLALFIFLTNQAQTTDLAISVEAQDLSGGSISNVFLFEEFQYLVTISNSGGPVSNASFTQTINPNVTILSYISQNPIAGATLITDFGVAGNVLTGTIASLPASSSIEVKVVVKAPSIIGGIATNVNISPPDDVTDTSPGNNTSIISIDVTDVVIDFTIEHAQISPPEGTAINAWGDSVTYQITITNHSEIAYPLDSFTTFLALNTPQSYGEPFAQLLSIECISATGGTDCVGDIDITPTPILLNSSSTETIFTFDTVHEYSSGGSLTFEMVYQYLEPECALIEEAIDVTSFAIIALSHDNESSNTSNEIITDLIEAQLCQETDVCLETIQIDPAVGTPIGWNEEITFETTICNNGPLDADVVVSFRNISNNALWDIISITCIESASTLPCSTVTFADADQYWVSNTFNMPVGEILTIQTVVIFIEPECAIGPIEGIIRSSITIESEDITDSFLTNNFDFDYLDLPPVDECDSTDIEVTKTQVSPALPEGGSIDDTTSWGPITYEITVSNLSAEDTFIELSEYMTPVLVSQASGVLESISCISTTGTASCFDIEHANIGEEFDGVVDVDDNPDVFWEILPEDDWLLPAASSVTFEIVINWSPICSASAIPAGNSVEAYPLSPFVDLELSNNTSSTTTFFAPCIDLVVQTFPEFPSVTVNQPFNWIVDITNSATSSNAIDVIFEDELESFFTIVGAPTCVVTSGTATCVSSFNVVDNQVSGIIPNMEANSTVRVFIPVEAPGFGGAFVNTAEANPNPVDREELTPETNISISSVQVLAPILTKLFNPDEIFEGEESILTFTINNLPSNPAQSNISFIDHLPTNIMVSGDAYWEEDNGCTATFISVVGADSFQVNDLTFPLGVASCTFSVPVTSNIAGEYINNNSNFTDQTNIDTSQANAMLTVLEDDNNPNPPGNEPCLEIPQGFSPNDDGYNDFFEIPCIENYPNAKLMIYNRYGTCVYSNNNYLNNWAGKPNKGILHSDSSLLPVGTYFYVLEHENLIKRKVGWVYLNY
ncbi:gliding motility-associated C-terminal domain-containing protein [Lacinutrix iliipiscaria]|uniref:Gliding motility-associated C-terminal domain-containing protein n=1 Tax=Lacinutrix iliipiscaria TaxID=1230532 RepID=A0ABW5WMU9_9FLAO